MAKSKGGVTLSGMIDTDLEDDTINSDAFPSPDSNQENKGTKGKSAKARPAAKKPIKTIAPSKRATRDSGISKNAPASRAKPSGKRVPLKEQTNRRHADGTEEVDEFAAQTEDDTVMDDATEPRAKARKSAPAAKGSRPQRAAGQERIAKKQDGEFEYTPTAIRTMSPARKIARQAVENVVQESQPFPETDEYNLPERGQDEREMPQSTLRHTAATRNHSQNRRPPTIPRRRAGSASSMERPAGVGDAATRRKLGEMTRKMQSLDLKYRTLRETGIKEAEANFERLRIQSEAKAKAAYDLINSLKRELAIHKALSADTSTIQKQIGHREADLQTARAQADDLSAQLAEAQNENKALQAKLANSRSVSAAVESLGSKTPNGAMRARQHRQSGRLVMVGSAEAAQAAQAAQLKEDLYSDLTGLILRGVERGAENDIYDCIQTGRNGTLHFKLAISKDPDSSYENTIFQYTPQLDDTSGRDRDLIALLPEYLTDEITFSQSSASMFYAKVMETLMAKRRKGGEDE